MVIVMTILFVCLGVFVSLENFPLIRRRYLYRWRAANFDLCSALMAIEQWEFFSVPHLLWHGSSPRTHDTHTYCRSFGSGAVTTCFNSCQYCNGCRDCGRCTESGGVMVGRIKIFVTWQEAYYILVEEALQSKLLVHAHFSAPREKVINSSS